MICGNKNFATVMGGQTLTPSLPGEKTLGGPGEAALSKWLWAVAISLILAPALRVMSIINVEIPALFGDENQAYLQSHPALSNLIYFEIGVNSLLVASALMLNFMFYTRRKKFPMFMVGYAAATVLFLVANTSAINSLFPDASMAPTYIGLVRMLIWAAALIPYLLTSSDVKKRFVK
jgi:hypothetical protein